VRGLLQSSGSDYISFVFMWYKIIFCLTLGNVKVISLLLGFEFFQVAVLFVDFGNTETVNQSELVLLDTVKKNLAEFPHQVSSYSELPANIIYHIYPNMRRDFLCILSSERWEVTFFITHKVKHCLYSYFS
jgi:hypothetical protein